MKRKFIFILLVAFVGISFVSCSDDDGYSLNDAWVSLGMVKKVTSNAYGYEIVNDQGDTLIPMASSGIRFYPTDSLRVLVNYTILDEVDNSTTKFYIRLNDVQKVLYKAPVQLTEANEDSLGSDEVDVVSVWVVRNMLNVEFLYYGNVLTHFINLAYTDKDASQPLQLEFRHNANNDGELYRYRGLATFDLNPLRREGQDSLSMVISAKGLNGNIQTFDKVYRY